MIEIKLWDESFSYDVHSLVKAFYPQEEVKVFSRGAFIRGAWMELEILLEEDVLSLELRAKGSQAGRQATRLDESQRERKELKNVLKRSVYQALERYKGEGLPWGTLTGIRPTKIPMTFLEQGWRNVEIAAYMRDTYLCSKEKTALAVSIANREREILKDIDYEQGYSLYVGIPFCPSICLYCSFSSSPIAQWKNRVEEYLDALCKELAFLGKAYAGKKLNTIYMGGGTPTTLEPDQLDRLMTAVEEHFSYRDLKELTVEAGRPDSLTPEKLKTLLKHGVQRISVNPQTMKQKTLDLIGRRHTVAETREAFFMAREAGFTNINMDLIVGLPGEEKEDVEETLKALRELSPDSITVHSLAIKRAARLALFKDQYEEIGLKNSEEIMDLTYQSCVEQELYPYYLYRQKNIAGNFENVGYAKLDKAGIYNILIMEEKQTILAAGAGAISKFVLPGERLERVENVKNVEQYINRIDEMIERKRTFMERHQLG